MADLLHTAPEEEQSICVTCGFCCDGTLFAHACLNQGERGHLPAKIEAESFTEDGSDYFRLPCHYFMSKCSIYDRRRADVCSSYRCQLLKDFAAGKVTLNDALGVISDAMNMRDRLLEQYRKMSDNGAVITFRQLLTVLGTLQKGATEKEPLSIGYEMLLAGCNIFEALMIKNLRSADDFEKMMTKSKDDQISTKH